MDFRFSRTTYTFCIGNFESHLSYPRYIQCALLTCLNFTDDINAEIRSMFDGNGQLERKVLVYNPNGTNERESLPFSVTLSCLIRLSSTYRRSLISYFPTIVRFARFFDALLEFNDEQRAMTSLTLPFRFFKTPPSVSPEFHLVALDSFIPSIRRHST